MVQAGDRCDFIGTLIVVPDVAQLQMEGMTIPYKGKFSSAHRGYMELRTFVVAMAICGPPKSEFVYECLNCALVDLLTNANTLNILI